MPHCSVGGRLHLGHLMNHFCGNGCKCFIHAVYAKEAFGLEEYAASTAEGPCFHAESPDIFSEFFPALPPRHLQDVSAARARLRRASRAAKLRFFPTCHPPVLKRTHLSLHLSISSAIPAHSSAPVTLTVTGSCLFLPITRLTGVKHCYFPTSTI